MILDLLSDLLARLNNGYRAKLTSIIVLKSRQTLIVLSLLVRLGYISGFKILNSRNVCVYLSYYHNQPAIRKLERISKPSQRIYFSVRDLNNRSATAQKTLGFYILSTTSGIITDVESLLLGIGGEVLFHVA